MRHETHHQQASSVEPLWMPFRLTAAIRTIKPQPSIIPVRDYAGETKVEALARHGIAGDIPDESVQFLHLVC